MELSKFFQHCRVYNAAQSSIEFVPSLQPAVYAFYEGLDFSRGPLIDEIDNYVTKHGRHISLNNANWPFTLEMNFRGNPSRFKGEGRALCQALPEARRGAVHELLHFLSIINEPMYVGKTEDLRTRFRSHHDNGFLWKMKDQFQRPPSEFVLFAFFCDADLVRLAEKPVDLARRMFAIALGSPADRKAILSDYSLQTENDEHVVVEYWKRAWALLR